MRDSQRPSTAPTTLVAVECTRCGCGRWGGVHEIVLAVSGFALTNGLTEYTLCCHSGCGVCFCVLSEAADCECARFVRVAVAVRVTLSVLSQDRRLRKQMCWRAPLTSRATPTARPRAQHVHSCRCTTREVEIKSRSVLRVEAGFKYFPRTPVDRPAPHAAQLGGGSRSTWRSARRWLALDMALSSTWRSARRWLALDRLCEL